MVLQATADFPRAAVCSPAAFPDHFEGAAAVLTQDRREEQLLLTLAERFGPRLLVPEVWSQLLPRAGVLISSALSGGTFAQRVADAAECYPRRCWLLLEPMAMEFSLPCPTGTGTPVPRPTEGNSFFSEALCCQYSHFVRNQQGFMLLWDTEHSLRQKMALAKQAGFLGYAVPPQALDSLADL